jgi:hypothetical protein
MSFTFEGELAKAYTSAPLLVSSAKEEIAVIKIDFMLFS